MDIRVRSHWPRAVGLSCLVGLMNCTLIDPHSDSTGLRICIPKSAQLLPPLWLLSTRRESPA